MAIQTLLNAIKHWANQTFVVKNNKDEALELVADLGLVEPLADENGAVYTDESGKVYIL